MSENEQDILPRGESPVLGSSDRKTDDIVIQDVKTDDDTKALEVNDVITNGELTETGVSTHVNNNDVKSDNSGSVQNNNVLTGYNNNKNEVEVSHGVNGDVVLTTNETNTNENMAEKNINYDDVEHVSGQFSFLNKPDEYSDAETKSISSEHSSESRKSPETDEPQKTNGIKHETAVDDSDVTNGGENHETVWNAAPKSNIDKSSKVKNPFKFLKRLTSKSEWKKDSAESVAKQKQSHLEKVLMEVKVDSLPQVFVTKYMGSMPCHGLWGIKHTRGPVDELIQTITEASSESGEDIPLVQLRVSMSGIHVREHSANKCTTKQIQKELIPIEFISYGVQDVKYTRVFTFILVREMSSKSRKLECHAYVCDSTANCRRLSLSVAMAFQEYSKKLDGQPYKFKVDLKPEEEKPHKEAQAAGGDDFEA